MSDALAGLRIGFLERRHPPGHEGALAERLVPLLQQRGAGVEVVHAEEGLHRLDVAPPWDLVVLKSGSAAALHLAAAVEAHGIPLVNDSEATRLVQDKLASVAILRRAGLPVPRSYLTWLGPGRLCPGASVSAGTNDGERGVRGLEDLTAGSWAVKSARGWQGQGLWMAAGEGLTALSDRLPDGPYLLMEHIAHTGDDLKVYVAGEWMTAIERPFPATTLAAKQGRPAPVPAEVALVVREAGRLLGVSCYGCDFVHGAGGWTLVDVNAFPGYKGAQEAAEALAAAIARKAGERCRS
jgi:ribosomal protein S6--L-glutamate ligase